MTARVQTCSTHTHTHTHTQKHFGNPDFVTHCFWDKIFI